MPEHNPNNLLTPSVRTRMLEMGQSYKDVVGLRRWFCLNLAELIAGEDIRMELLDIEQFDLVDHQQTMIMILLQWEEQQGNISLAIDGWIALLLNARDDYGLLRDFIGLLHTFVMLGSYPPKDYRTGTWGPSLTRLIGQLTPALMAIEKDTSLTAHDIIGIQSAGNWIKDNLQHLWA